MAHTNRRKNTTTVTTDTATVTATTNKAASRKTGSGSARQQLRAELLARIRQAYWALPAQALNGFQALCRLMPGNQVITKTGTRLKIGPYVLFSTLNQAVHYSGAAQSVTVPPTTPVTPQPIPSGLQLVSSYDNTGQWSLLLTGVSYQVAVSVAVAPPAPKGANYRSNDYVQAGPLPGGLVIDGTDISALFLDVYPAAPVVGQQVGVQVTGVTSYGFATPKLSLKAITADASAQATDEDDAQLAA